MGTLVNPSHSIRIGSPSEGDPSNMLMRFFSFMEEYTVVIWDDDTVSPYPGITGFSIDNYEHARNGSGEGGKAVFRGGYAWDQITDDEAVLLRAAGYTVED